MIEVLTAVLVVITGFYAWATYRILLANERVVEVMHEQADAITRPYISISPVIEPDNPIFHLRISNAGKTAALKLRLIMDKSFYKFGEKSGEKDIASYPAFNQIIDSFPPGAEITFYIAQSFKLFAENADREILPTSFCITAEYSYGNKTVKEDNVIDFRPYLGAALPQDAYVRKLKDMIKAIEKVANNIDKNA